MPGCSVFSVALAATPADNGYDTCAALGSTQSLFRPLGALLPWDDLIWSLTNPLSHECGTLWCSVLVQLAACVPYSNVGLLSDSQPRQSRSFDKGHQKPKGPTAQQ